MSKRLNDSELLARCRAEQQAGSIPALLARRLRAQRGYDDSYLGGAGGAAGKSNCESGSSGASGLPAADWWRPPPFTCGPAQQTKMPAPFTCGPNQQTKMPAQAKMPKAIRPLTDELPYQRTAVKFESTPSKGPSLLHRIWHALTRNDHMNDYHKTKELNVKRS